MLRLEYEPPAGLFGLCSLDGPVTVELSLGPGNRHRLAILSPAGPIRNS